MKDYTLYENEQKHFILGYEINNHEIIVKYADGKKTKHFISKQTVDLLNAIMEHQVSTGNKYHMIFEQDLKEEKKFILYYTLILILILPNIFFPIGLPVISIFSKALLGLVIYLDGKSIFNAKKISDKLKDIEKSNLFLENKNVLLSDKDNQLNVIKKAKNQTYSNLIEDNYFNINDIDSVSLKTIKDELETPKVKVKK